MIGLAGLLTMGRLCGAQGCSPPASISLQPALIWDCSFDEVSVCLCLEVREIMFEGHLSTLA